MFITKEPRQIQDSYPWKPVLSDWPLSGLGHDRPSGTAAVRWKDAPHWKSPWQQNVRPCSWQRGGGRWRGRRGWESVCWCREGRGQHTLTVRTTRSFLDILCEGTHVELSVMTGMSAKLTSSPSRFTSVSWRELKKRKVRLNLAAQHSVRLRRFRFPCRRWQTVLIHVSILSLTILTFNLTF